VTVNSDLFDAYLDKPLGWFHYFSSGLVVLNCCHVGDYFDLFLLISMIPFLYGFTGFGSHLDFWKTIKFVLHRISLSLILH